MMDTKFFLVLILCVVAVITTTRVEMTESVTVTELLRAGQCESFESAPQPCTGVLVESWSRVWTAPAYGLTQEYFNAAMLQAVDPSKTSDSYFVSTLDAMPALQYDCAKHYASLVCPTFFQPCVPAGSPLTSSPYPIPLPVCRSVCEAVNDACRSSNLQIDCAQINPLTGTDRWPVVACTSTPIPLNATYPSNHYQSSSTTTSDDISSSSTSDDISSSTTSSSTSSTTSDISSTSSSSSSSSFVLKTTNMPDIEFPCPKPLIFVAPDEDPFTGLACSSTCSKIQLFWGTTKEKFNELFVTVSVLGWISLICSTLVLVVYGVYPSLREYPTRLIWCTAVGTFFVSLGFAGSSTQHPGNFMCNDGNFEYETQGWCRFAGWCLFFGGMVTASWWLMQALVLCYNVGLQQYKARLDKKFEWVLHLIGWGYPITASLILLFVPNNNSGGAPGFFPWCFANTASTGLWWGLFYGPFCFELLVVIICISITLFRIGVMGGKSTMSKKHLAPFFFSIGLFGFWYALTIISILVMKGYTTQVHDRTADQVKLWYQCVFTTPDVWQDCPFPEMDYGIAWFIGIMVSFTGTTLFLIFVVFRERTRQIISTSFRNLIEGRSFLSEESTTNSSRHSGSSTNPRLH